MLSFLLFLAEVVIGVIAFSLCVILLSAVALTLRLHWTKKK